LLTPQRDCPVPTESKHNVNINGSLSTLSWNVSGPITLGEVNMDGNILKNPVLGMLMHHASFQGAVKQSTGGISYVYDGSARLTVNGAGSWCYIRNHDLFNYCNGLNRRGAFVSVRTQFYGLAYQPTGYILAGGTINTALKNGFGFKLDGSSLLGVVRNDYAENTLNTGISVSEFTSYDLIAVVRSSSSVEYFVNGVSRGILTGAPLPAGADGMYECRITTALDGGDSGLLVGYLTVGIPMY